MFLKRWYIWQSPHPGGKRVPEEGTNERETPFTISFWGNFGLNSYFYLFIYLSISFIFICDKDMSLLAGVYDEMSSQR